MSWSCCDFPLRERPGIVEMPWRQAAYQSGSNFDNYISNRNGQRQLSNKNKRKHVQSKKKPLDEEEESAYKRKQRVSKRFQRQLEKIFFIYIKQLSYKQNTNYKLSFILSPMKQKLAYFPSRMQFLSYILQLQHKLHQPLTFHLPPIPLPIIFQRFHYINSFFSILPISIIAYIIVNKLMSKHDYYELLGLTKTATDSDIKRAYKKQAVKWHPDKNPNNRDEAVQKFREITQAYQNLSDPEKRKIYDTYGFNTPKSTNFTHFDFSQADDIFAKFFSTNDFDHDEDDFFSNFFNRRKNGKQSGFGGFSNGFSSFFGENEDLFKNGFGGSSFPSSGFSGTGGTAKSVSTTTKTINGKTVTTKKTTITKQDGSKEVTEEVIDNGKKTENKYILGPGESQNGTKAKLKY